jgi:MSHA biogenesis protein MshP
MNQQRGVSIVAALFLIVVLAAVGGFAMQIGTSQQQTINLSILQARAQAAADAGIEWGSSRALLGNTCPSGILSLNQGALRGFTVSVTSAAPCPTTQVVAGVGRQLFTFTAVATRGTYGTADFVSRKATRTVSNAPLP